MNAEEIVKMGRDGLERDIEWNEKNGTHTLLNRSKNLGL